MYVNECRSLQVYLKKNIEIFITKVMRCARDGVPKEAAVDPCNVCGKRVEVNSIYCPTCGYWVHR